ncbi:MAG TPA: phosphoribosylformylglycinamidine synthase subunit PurS [bacterium]|nr:phosphoribosylformylglycinamidine synthase subunit PurS [bacterium]
MPAFRVLIMLKPGVLDAAGQAVERGLSALGYRVEGVRVGKAIEVASSDASPETVHEMCERFLANPLIESWCIEQMETGPNPAAQSASAPGALREGRP